MYIKCGKIKVYFEDEKKFFKRLKGFMFRLEPIDKGKRFPKCRSIHTYFMFQRIDIIMTDKDNKILYMYPSFGSERIIFPKKKVYYTYEFPIGVCDYYKVGDVLKIYDEK